jgi:hypothetical protein
MFPPRGIARRSWPGAWLGICATMLAFAWAAPQAGSAATAGAVAARADAAAMRAAVSLPSDGAGTMVVSPASVSASQTTTLTFTYTATAARPMQEGSIELVVPPGWTPPSQAPGPGYTTASCPPAIPQAPPCDLAVSRAAMTITITNVSRNVHYGMTVVITYQGQAPATGGTSTFTAAEQSNPGGMLTQLAESPAVAVTCPDGAGTMTVSPSAMTASSTGTLTFTYVAGGCGVETGGVIALTVPYGWTRPTTTSGQDGFITSSGGGPPTVSSPMTVSSPITITVPVRNLGPGGTVSIDYDMARVPASPGDYAFDAAEKSGAGGNLTALTASPAVMVNAPPPPSNGGAGQGTVTPSPPVHPGGAGQMTVEPARVAASVSSTLTFSYTAPEAGLSPSGEVTVQVPAGWTAPSQNPGQAGYASSSRGRLSVSGRLITVSGAALGSGQTLTITYAHGTAPNSAGVSTFVTSERPDGTAGLAALAVSPAVTVALVRDVPPAASWPTIPVLVAGLVLVACAASGLAIRRLRRRAHAAAGSSIRAVPHTGPPTTLAVRDTGTRPTLVVRVEPHPGDPVTTIEEARP